MDRTLDSHVQVEAPVEHEIYDEDESYNIDIDWGPVRAVPVTMAVSKEVGKMAFDVVEASSPPSWARGHAASTTLRCTAARRSCVKNRIR
jgi:hypothetical protein